MTYLLRIYVLYTYKRVLYVYMCTTHINVFYTYICILVIICTEYLEQQKKWIEGRTATNLGMGYCKDVNGRRTQGCHITTKSSQKSALKVLNRCRKYMFRNYY